MRKINKLLEYYADDDLEVLQADGFDSAILGMSGERLVYSVSKCIEILMESDMTHWEACEYFSFNVEGSYVGEKTPIWVNDEFLF